MDAIWFAGLCWGFLSAITPVVGALCGAKFLPGAKARGVFLAFGAGGLFAAIVYELIGKTIFQLKEAEELGKASALVGGVLVGALWFFYQDIWLKKMLGCDNSSLNRNSALDMNIGLLSDEDAHIKHDPGVGIGVWLGMMIDNIPEAIVFGIQIAKEGSPDPLFLISIMIADFPQAVGVVADWHQARWRPLYQIVTVWLAIPLLRGPVTAVTAQLLKGYDEETDPLFVVIAEGVAGGAMMLVSINELLPEALRLAGHYSGLVCVFAFSLLSLLAVAFKYVE